MFEDHLDDTVMPVCGRLACPRTLSFKCELLSSILLSGWISDAIEC
jgi:hypothetical protein